MIFLADFPRRPRQGERIVRFNRALTLIEIAAVKRESVVTLNCSIAFREAPRESFVSSFHGENVRVPSEPATSLTYTIFIEPP